MRFLLFTILFTIIISISFSPVVIPVSAKEKLITFTEVWPPFRIKDNAGKYGYTGIDIDILKGLEDYLDAEIVIQRAPFARALEQIRNGDADLITGVAYTDERNEYIEYVSPSYYSVGPVFYTQKGRGSIVNRYDDLYKYTVGYSIDSAYFEPFNSDSKLNKIGIKTEEQLIQMVALGRLDVTIGTNPNFAYDLRRYGLSDKLEQTKYIPKQQTPIFIGLSKKEKNKELKNKIETYLEMIISNGDLAEIISKYK